MLKYWLTWVTSCPLSSRMYPQVGLCLDVACQLQGLGLLFLVQAEHVCRFLDTWTLNKCLLSMICKCVLPHVEELGSLVIWLVFKIVSAWLMYDKLGYQVPLFSAFSWQYPSYQVHQTVKVPFEGVWVCLILDQDHIYIEKKKNAICYFWNLYLDHKANSTCWLDTKGKNR